MTHEIRKAAEYWCEKSGDSTDFSLYVEAAQYGYALAIQRLRSEEAQNKPRKAGTQFEFEKTWDTGEGWADWLEQQEGK